MPRQLSPSEAHAHGDVEAVGVLVAFVAVRRSDVDGRGQRNGHVHCDDGPRPEKNERHRGNTGALKGLQREEEDTIAESRGRSP